MYGDLPVKMGSSRPAFQGHRNRRRSIGYLGLPISDPSKIANFSPPCI